MYSEGKIKQDIIDRLLKLDEEAALSFDDPNTYYEMVLVGGGALVLIDKLSRATQDIDAIMYPKELNPFLEKYDINNNVLAYMNNFAPDYYDRRVPINIPSKKIKFFTASLEDIVIAKLFSNRPKDMQDIHNPDILNALDWNRLDEIVNSEDFKDGMLNDHQYIMFMYNSRDYKEEAMK
ncbi:MAG: hypothetical protein J1F11_04130 [Oscillospiraceae bacterium]|nr:hypothetical protein [Oscillospiraceae bacterium]